MTELHGARVLDLYASLVKVSEAMAFLASNCGMVTSRYRRYRTPPAELVAEAVSVYGLNELG